MNYRGIDDLHDDKVVRTGDGHPRLIDTIFDKRIELSILKPETLPQRARMADADSDFESAASSPPHPPGATSGVVYNADTSAGGPSEDSASSSSR